MIIGILNILKIFIPPVSNLIASILRKKEEIGGFFINFYQGIIINIVIKKLLVLNIYLNIYFLIKLVLEIFKLPANISTAYPNVKIIKKIKPINNPNVPTLDNETLIGKNKIISKSKIKKAKVIRKKDIWKVFLVWPKIGLKPHS